MLPSGHNCIHYNDQNRPVLTAMAAVAHIADSIWALNAEQQSRETKTVGGPRGRRRD